MLDSLNLTVDVPCVKGQYGSKLDSYVTQIRPSQIKTLLGHDPQSKNWNRLPENLKNIYSYLQRKTSKGRREGTKAYIQNRIHRGLHVGAFPDIAVGVTRPLTFRSFSEKHSDIKSGVGVLEFSLAEEDTRVLLDGLSRISGALELIEEGRKDIADSFTFGVAIFAPQEGELTPEELGQLFHDFNFLQTPVATAQAIDLDQSDLHIIATNQLAGLPVIVDNGGMERRSSSLGSKSTALVAQRVLLRFVRGACEGGAWQHTLRSVPIGDANLTSENLEQMVSEIARFLEEVSDRMGSDRFTQRDAIHLTAPGWNALGVICHDVLVRLKDRLTPFEEGAIYDRIADIDWSRFNPDWIDYLGHTAVDEDGVDVTDTIGRKKLGKLYGGQQAITKLVDYIRGKTRLTEHLATLPEPDADVDTGSLDNEAA